MHEWPCSDYCSDLQDLAKMKIAEFVNRVLSYEAAQNEPHLDPNLFAFYH